MGWVAGNQDKKVEHKCASRQNVGRLAGLKVQHDRSLNFPFSFTYSKTNELGIPIFMTINH